MFYSFPILRHTLLSIVIALAFCFTSRGQFWDGATGLLQAPSAETNKDGMFMITNCFLNKHSISTNRWGYHTFGYSFNITLWSRIEIGYDLVLLDGKRRLNPSDRDLIEFNQDRHFTAKVLLLRENEFGASWIPALAIGLSDPATSTGGEYIGSDVAGSSGNALFNRYYIVATKHFTTGVGNIGTHVGYQYNRRQDIHYNGPCVAIDWTPIWLHYPNFSLRAIAEYDARTFNVGFIASIWQDRF